MIRKSIENLLHGANYIMCCSESHLKWQNMSDISSPFRLIYKIKY